jgi:hypothetical protein
MNSEPLEDCITASRKRVISRCAFFFMSVSD